MIICYLSPLLLEPEKSIEGTQVAVSPTVMLVNTREERHETWWKLFSFVGTVNLPAIMVFASSTKMARRDHVPESSAAMKCKDIYIGRENRPKRMLPFRFSFLAKRQFKVWLIILYNAPKNKRNTWSRPQIHNAPTPKETMVPTNTSFFLLRVFVSLLYYISVPCLPIHGDWTWGGLRWQEMQLRSSAITYNTAVSVCQETDMDSFFFVWRIFGWSSFFEHS